MLQEWVCQHPMWDTDKLRQRLIDRQTVINWAIDRKYLGSGRELWPEADILNISHGAMFYYWTALLVDTFSNFMWCFI